MGSIVTVEKEYQYIQIPKRYIVLKSLDGKIPLAKFKMRVIGMNVYADMYVINPRDVEINIMTFELGHDCRGFSYVFDRFAKMFNSKFIENDQLIYHKNDNVNIISRNSNFSVTCVTDIYTGNGSISSVSHGFDATLDDQIIIDHIINFKNGNHYKLNRYAVGIKSDRHNFSSGKKIVESRQYKLIKSHENGPIFVMESIVYNDTFDFHLMPVIECIDSRSGEWVYVCAHIYLLEYIDNINGNIKQNELWEIATKYLDIKCMSYDCRVCVAGKEKYSLSWIEDDSIELSGNIKEFERYDINILPYFDGLSVYAVMDISSKSLGSSAHINVVLYGTLLTDMGLIEEDDYGEED